MVAREPKPDGRADRAGTDEAGGPPARRSWQVTVPDRLGRWGLAVLAGALVPTMAVFGLFLLGPRPSATVEVRLDPISINELLDPLTPAPAAEEAMAEQVDSVIAAGGDALRASPTFRSFAAGL